MHTTMMDRPLNVIDLIRHAQRNTPNVEIVSHNKGGVFRYTYHDAYQRICQLARSLLKLGIKPGDRIATLAWNTHQHFELFYACAGIGAICHTVNPRLLDNDIAWIIEQAEDRILFFDASFLSVVQGIRLQLGHVESFVILDERQRLTDTGVPHLIEYEALLADSSSQELDWPVLDEQLGCGLCYTSGTTGRPKGVLYSHRSTLLHAYASALPDALNLSSQDCVLPIVPMFHVNAWGLPYSLPLVGAKIVLPGSDLSGESLYRLCEAEGVTLTAGVPTVWLGLLNYLGSTQQRFTHLTRTIIGGSAVSESMLDTLENTYQVKVVHAWGMTELSPVGTVNQSTPATQQLSAPEQKKLKLKQGREVFGIELQIVDEAGKACPRDGITSGHLMVRGPWVTGRYVGESGSVSDTGWFDTGDIATIDTYGFMQIVDRSKDVIKSGGEWISSIELENAALNHPAVREAAVIAIPHEKWIERPLLICVLNSEQAVSSQALQQFLAERVPKWWIPDEIRFIENIPHGPTGKILKTRLREQFTSVES